MMANNFSMPSQHSLWFVVLLGLLMTSTPSKTRVHALCNDKQRATFALADTLPRLVPSSSKITTRLHKVNRFNIFGGGPMNNGGSIHGDEAFMRQKGILVLFTVPMAWGTFEPCVRLVYQIQPDIPPFVFSFLYYIIAAFPLIVLAFRQVASEMDQNDKNSTSFGNLLNYAFLASSEQSDSARLALSSTQVPLRGGFELGTYLFVGNGLQVVGLKTVPADRAAFLLQLTTIFVPLVQAIMARDIATVPVVTWLACFIALGGVGLMGLDGATHDATSLAALENLSWSSAVFSLGDLWVILAAVAYSFHCIRLETFAKTTSAEKLAAAKAATEALWSLVLVLVCVFVALAAGSESSPEDHLPVIFETARSSGHNILDYWVSVRDEFAPAGNADPTATGLQGLTLAAAISWTGLVTVAYTIYAQSFGQAYVTPSAANLIYTIQPVFTAIFAWIVLGESLGFTGYLGGALIGAAVLLVIKDSYSFETLHEE